MGKHKAHQSKGGDPTETYEEARKRVFGSSEPQRLGAVRFDGVLIVTDAEKLRIAVCNGIGTQKAFGFGLLSIAPLRDKS